MITRIHFHDGQYDFRQRWAKTDKWKLENEAGKSLFGAYRNPLTDDEAAKGAYRGTANTNAFVHGGKLYALKKDSPALAVDAASMETDGYSRFNGAMEGQTFTAHPKIDPASGNVIGFGYGSTGLCTTNCMLYEVTPEGELVHQIAFTASYYAMMHDFGITPDSAVFNLMPSIGSWERLEQGLPHFGFDTTMPVYLGVLPRHRGATGADIRWFKSDNSFNSHVMNAFQEGSKVHFDIPVAKNNMFPFFPDVHGAPFNGMEAMSYLTRWTVDMASNSEAFESEVRLTDTAGEFSRIDDRFAGQPYRDGWIVQVCNRMAEHRSDLLVFDALETDEGVIIQIRNKGLRHGSPEVMARLVAGEEVDPTEYYFRTVPEFTAPTDRYDWLNKSIFICAGARFAARIKLWVWHVT